MPRLELTCQPACAALHFACQKGHVDAARALLAGGAKVTCKTSKGATPLHHAAQSGACSASCASRVPRLTACAGCVRLVEILLRKRADPRAQNKQGKTPADVATGEAKPLLERKLAEAAASAEAADGGEAAGAEEPSAPDDTPVAAVEPAAAGAKRSLAEDIPASADTDKAKKPKVVLTFDDGEEEAGV